MRNMLKKVSCVILSMIMICANPVYAEDTVSATVTYYCDDYFYIEIPDTIVVGDECVITANEINISPSKTVYVDLMPNPNDFVTIYNEVDPNETLDVYFMNSDGNNIAINDTNLVSFEYGSDGTSKTFSTYVNDTTGKPAGEYSGTAMFSIHCD